MKKQEGITSNKNFFHAIKNALSGIWYVINTQRNIKIQLVVATIVIIAGIYFKLSKIEFIFLIFSCGLVIITEMINTAIEETVNLITNQYHPLAKIAKDVGAGSVLVSSIVAVIVGCFLFLEKIL